MKKNRDFIKILEYVLAAAFVVYTAFLLAREGGSSVSVDVINEKISQAAELKGMKKGSVQELKKYYGLNVNDYDGVVLYVPDDLMSVNEVLVVKLKDKAQAETVENAVKKRLETQKTSFEGYGVEQTKLIESAIQEYKGYYMLLVISEDADDIYAAFKKSI